jgi:hypothetical protein
MNDIFKNNKYPHEGKIKEHFKGYYLLSNLSLKFILE